MKLLSLIKKDIGVSMKSNPFLLFVIVLGMGAALMTHLISYSVIQYESRLKSKYAVYNTFTVPNLDSKDNIDFGKIMDNDDIVNAFVLFASPDDNVMIVGWHGEKPGNWFPLGEGEFLKPDGDPFSAYVSDEIALFRPGRHDTITISGEVYNIIGSTRLNMINLLNGLNHYDATMMYDYEKFAFIPLERLLSIEYCDALLRIQIKPSATEKNQHIYQVANTVLGNKYLADMIYPPSPLADSWVNNMLYFISIGILCIISFINILALYWNFLSKSKRKYTIFSFVGATSTQLWIYVTLQYVILFFASSITAVLFALIMRPSFSKINLFYNIDFMSFASVILFELVSTFAVSVPQMRNIVQQRIPSKLGRGNG